MTVNDFIEAFAERISAYCQVRQWSPTRFGQAAVNDGHFVRRLRARSLTLGTIQRAEDFMQDNPPERAS
ncbi:MAG TPA: hypothetical protein EYP07_14810 [Kiloniellaceae bacterium]|nr:hypothetical protein [Kiloniellaceae bacterium]